MQEIEPTTPQQRTLNPLAFFFIWAGAGISLAEVLAGGLLRPVGFAAGTAANVLGHLVGTTLLCLGGIIGTDHGVPSMVSLRPSLGLRGSCLASALNIMQLVGWTAVMLVVAARSLDAIARQLLGFSNYPVWVVVMGLATTAWAYAGRERWKWLQSLTTSVLLALCVYVGYVIVAQVGLRSLAAQAPTGEMGFGLATDLVIAMPLSWLPLIADYSRFGRSARGSFGGSWLGYFVSSSLMYLLGLGAALSTGKADIIETFVSLGMGAAALFVVAFSTLTTAFLDVYSAAMSTQNLVPRSGERPLVVAAGLVGTLVALFFPIERYESFLLFIGALFVPLFGVVLADYFLIRRRRIRTDHLFDRAGEYWYARGVNPVAVAAWALGVALYYLCAETAFPLGSSVPSFLLASVAYVVVMRCAPGLARGTWRSATAGTARTARRGRGAD